MNKAGKRVEFGFKWIIHRIGGGYIFGRRVEAQADENKMPIEAVKDYKEVFGLEAKPEMSVYDRGGCALNDDRGIAQAGSREGRDRAEGKNQMVSCRGRPKRGHESTRTNRRQHRNPQAIWVRWAERSNQTVEAAGQRAMVSVNLNKLMRDVVNREKEAQVATA